MSISNIFKCCKKTEILLGVSGITLGIYATTGYLTKPIKAPEKENRRKSPEKKDRLRPIINDNSRKKDNNDNKDLPTDKPFLRRKDDDTDNQPIFNLYSNDKPLTWFDFFINSNQVVIRGGLAIIASGGIIYAISALSYYAIKLILQRIQMRNPGNPVLGGLNPQIAPNRNNIRPLNEQDLRDTLKIDSGVEKKLDEQHKIDLDINEKLHRVNLDLSRGIERIRGLTFELKENFFIQRPSNIVFEEEDEKQEVEVREVEEIEVLEQIVDNTDVYTVIENYELFKEKLRKIMNKYKIRITEGNFVEFQLSENEIDRLYNMFNIPRLISVTQNITREVSSDQTMYFNNIYEQITREIQEIYLEGGARAEIDTDIVINDSSVEITERISVTTIDNRLRFQSNLPQNYITERSFYTTLAYLFNILSKVGLKYKFVNKMGEDNFLIMLEYLLKELNNMNRNSERSKKILAYKALVSIIKDIYLNLHYKK